MTQYLSEDVGGIENQAAARPEEVGPRGQNRVLKSDTAALSLPRLESLLDKGPIFA